MTRSHSFLLIAVALAAVGCRSFEERAGLFPRLRDRIDPDDDHRQPYYRGDDRLASAPKNAIAPTGNCVPCGGYSSPINPYGGMTLGSPTVLGGGYATPAVSGGYGIPTGYSSGPSYSSGPVLGTPIYPSVDGGPYRPRRDDELPQPGGYSQPGAAEMGRSTAPKPPGSLPTGK
jgi:hypothetical protein